MARKLIGPLGRAARALSAAGRGLFRGFEWWQIALLIIGILAVISAALGIFLLSGRLTGDFSGRELADPASPEFVAGAARIMDTAVEAGGQAVILHNGDAFLHAVLADIANAKTNITFTNYIWEKGAFSDALMAALLERARSGVRVLILLDDVGAMHPPKEQLEELRQLGGDVAYFRKPRIGSLSEYNQRSHRRAIVIDGAIGYVGGIAIQDSWLGDADAPDRWRDYMVRFTGPPVEHIQNAFGELWTVTTGEVLGSSFYSSPSGGVSGISSSSMKTVSILSSPGAGTERLPILFWYSFASAKHSLYITNPYFLPPPAVLAAGTDAAKRGVDVRVLLPSNLTDAKAVRLASQSNYRALLDAGVKVYEYQRSRIHSKVFVVDGIWSVIGSANMDTRSAVLNEENNIGVQDAEFGERVQAAFWEDLKDAREITKEEWDRRSPFLIALQYLAKVFQKQF